MILWSVRVQAFHLDFCAKGGSCEDREGKMPTLSSGSIEAQACGFYPIGEGHSSVDCYCNL